MPQNRKSQLKSYLRFSGIAIQMGATIYLGSKLGEWLDVKLENADGLYVKICTLAAVFFAMFSVIRQVINFTNKNE